MGTKRNHRFGGGLRGGLKGIVGKAKSVLSRTPSPDDEKVNNNNSYRFAFVQGLS